MIVKVKILIIKVISVFVILFLFSCKKDLKQEAKFITENDSLNYKITYYKNGNIKYKDQFIIEEGDTIFEGISSQYYSNGVLKTRSFMKNGKVQGYIYNYHKNGELRKVGFIKDDKAIGVWKTYYINGSIKTYAVNDIYGDMRFYKVYDSLNNKVIRKKGNHFIQQIQNNDSLKHGDTLKLNLFIATPPKTNLNFKVSYYYNHSLGSQKKKYEIVDNRVKIDTILNKKGDYKINFELEVIDSIKNTVNKETHSSKLYIYQ